MPEHLALTSGGASRTIGAWAFLLALALLPIVVIPVAWFPFQLTKTMVFAALLAIAAVATGMVVWRDKMLLVPRSAIAAAVLSYLAAVALAAFISQNPAASILGDAVEVNTLFFTALLVASFLVGGLLVKSVEAANRLWVWLLAAGVVGGVFQIIQIAFGPGLFGEQLFTTVSANLVGGWNDFGAYMAFVAVLAMLSIDVLSTRGRMLALPLAALVLSVCALSAVNLGGFWWVTLAVAVASGAIAYRAAMQSGASQMARIPYASIFVAAISVVFLVWGSIIGPKLADSLGIEELAVRPSATGTVEVLRGTYAQSTLTTLFGSGPNTFSEQWLIHKPAEVNLSNFWGADFNAGFSSIATLFIELGIVGGLLFISIPLLIAAGIYMSVRRSDIDAASRTQLTVAGLLSLSLFAVMLAYPANQITFILAFAIAGSFAAVSARQRVTFSMVDAAESGLSSRRYVAYGMLVLLIALPLTLAGIAGQRFLASVYLGQALAAGSADDLNRAAANAERSLAIRTSDDALRVLSDISIVRAQQLLASDASADEKGPAFQQLVTEAITHARAAVAASPREYANWLTLARIYEGLIPAGVTGAYQSAQQTYVEAIRRNPRNPGIYLAAARMEGAAGSEQTLRDAVTQALTLKPNYTDAVLLLVQLEIAKNNLQGAIQASMAAVQTAPDNAGLWLQLGLLALNANAPADAVIAFERALTLIPDYANAKYFLGLTYYQLGRATEAAGLFADLAATNPDNAEVALVLENIRANRPPFAGATPPVQNPTSPSNPPIKEQ